MTDGDSMDIPYTLAHAALIPALIHLEHHIVQNDRFGPAKHSTFLRALVSLNAEISGRIQVAVHPAPHAYLGF
ncbi:hypothetical protein [Marinobacter sp. P4B1]|uniref:hypothetical protein n=1 Tax=Marinobacter sp. P4B1 TaxID=1119533 RepID=UPI00071DD2F8|nr:hypothetical protein [Marinobacter sp. P4B1]KRW83691.1 hypothetical protein AQ621_16715 [Marinobacter sp. P4B1]